MWIETWIKCGHYVYYIHTSCSVLFICLFLYNSSLLHFTYYIQPFRFALIAVLVMASGKESKHFLRVSYTFYVTCHMSWILWTFQMRHRFPEYISTYLYTFKVQLFSSCSLDIPLHLQLEIDLWHKICCPPKLLGISNYYMNYCDQEIRWIFYLNFPDWQHSPWQLYRLAIQYIHIYTHFFETC